MAGQTTNYHLVKPTEAEAASVSIMNSNMDTIDAALGEKMPIANNEGTEGQILRSDGDGGCEWGSPATNEELVEAVGDWMEENIPTGQTIAVDQSFQVPGAAADAKLTGDRFGEVDDMLQGLAAKKKITTPAAVMTFTDGAQDMPAEVQVAIEPVQSGSGDPSAQNVRAITGWTGCTIKVANGNDSSASGYVEKSHAITFPETPGTVYGGTLTVKKDGSATLVVTKANIASYNGETLPGVWISDRDVYSAGGTPTTGAQVVYELATPYTYNFTAEQVRTLVGLNCIFANTGNVQSVEYAKDTDIYIATKSTVTITDDNNGNVTITIV